MSASSPRKFLFEESFETAADRDSTAQAGKRVPKYSAEDLERARAEGFESGRQAGEQEARSNLEQDVAAALDGIERQVPALFQALAETEERRARDSVAAAITVVRKFFPRLARQHGLAEVEALVADCLERLREEPRIVVRVADPLLDPVRERVGQLAERAGFEGKIVFLAEDGFGPGDVRVEWADGGAERDSRHLWHEIDEVIARIMGPHPPAAEPSPSAPEHAPAAPPRAARPRALASA